jgi:hypothetical protein
LALQVVLQLGRPSQRRPELLAVLSAHPLKEVEPGGAEWPHAGDGGAPEHPVGQQRGAGQRVRTATRPAGRVEPGHLEVLDDRQSVGCAVGDHPARLP